MNISALSSLFSTPMLQRDSASRYSAPVSSATSPQGDTPQLSTIGSLMAQLQDLQHTDPTKFKEVTSAISQKLRDAATTASSSGQSDQAIILGALADKFDAASKTGQMPALQSAGAGHHRHHHHGQGTSAASASSQDTGNTGTSATSSSANSASFKDILAMYQQGAMGSDPMATLTQIMDSALSAQYS